jgi:preprotein translocase subunit SecG
MNIAFNIILLLHVAAAIGVIILVLLQHGKGADMGAAFGGGSAGSLFGASGSANFMSRLTGILAAVFFLTSLSMAYIATHKPKSGGGVMDSVTNMPKAPVVPVAPGVPSPAAIPGQSGAAVPVAPVVPVAPPASGGAEAPKSTQIPK